MVEEKKKNYVNKAYVQYLCKRKDCGHNFSIHKFYKPSEYDTCPICGGLSKRTEDGKMHGGISIETHLNNTLALSSVEAKDNSIREIRTKISSIHEVVLTNSKIAQEFHKNLKHQTIEEIEEFALNVSLFLHELSNEI